MASLMAPDSRQLPIELALVFENGGVDSFVFEVDTKSSTLISSDGTEYRASSFSVLIPPSTQLVQSGSSLVPFWLPAGKKAVTLMSFVPLRANSKLLFHFRIR